VQIFKEQAFSDLFLANKDAWGKRRTKARLDMLRYLLPHDRRVCHGTGRFSSRFSHRSSWNYGALLARGVYSPVLSNFFLLKAHAMLHFQKPPLGHHAMDLLCMQTYFSSSYAFRSIFEVIRWLTIFFTMRRPVSFATHGMTDTHLTFYLARKVVRNACMVLVK
jgi:hypothetical protein